jgi:hypothetical protein
MIMITDPVHIAEDDTPMKPGYCYDSTGVGVQQELIDAVLAKWASANPYGDPAGTLAAVNQGALNKVGNIARMAVAATLEAMGLVDEESGE